MNRRFCVATVAAVCADAALGAWPRIAAAEPPAGDAPAVKVGTTLENMQAAYNGESNAHAKYVAWARKADEEGYGPVASLFRAAAEAEKTHAGALAKAIRKLKGEPKAELVEAKVGSTAENLQAAIEGESYEAEAMYPAFIKQARADRNTDAVKAFNAALEAEKLHAKYYRRDAARLAELKTAGGVEYHVCPVCGYTVDQADFTFADCPICSTKAKEFALIK